MAVSHNKGINLKQKGISDDFKLKKKLWSPHYISALLGLPAVINVRSI